MCAVFTMRSRAVPRGFSCVGGGRSARASEQLDATPRTDGVCQSNVAGEKVDDQCFSECDVGGVVDGEAVAQFPAPAKQRLMRSACDWCRGKVCGGGTGTAGSR